MQGSFYGHKIMLSIAENSAQQAAASENAKQELHSVLIAAVFSAIAVEGFVNEFGSQLDIFGSVSNEPDARICGAAQLMKDLEEQNAQLLAKFRLLAFVLSGKYPPAGRNPVQDLATLVRVRNSLVHFKPLDTFAAEETADGRQAMKFCPASILKAIKSELLSDISPSTSTMWISRIATPQFAEWCCATAKQSINFICDVTPNDSNPGIAIVARVNRIA